MNFDSSGATLAQAHYQALLLALLRNFGLNVLLGPEALILLPDDSKRLKCRACLERLNTWRQIA